MAQLKDYSDNGSVVPPIIFTACSVIIGIVMYGHFDYSPVKQGCFLLHPFRFSVPFGILLMNFDGFPDADFVYCGFSAGF